MLRFNVFCMHLLSYVASQNTLLCRFVFRLKNKILLKVFLVLLGHCFIYISAFCLWSILFRLYLKQGYSNLAHEIHFPAEFGYKPDQSQIWVLKDKNFVEPSEQLTFQFFFVLNNTQINTNNLLFNVRNVWQTEADRHEMENPVHVHNRPIISRLLK